MGFHGLNKAMPRAAAEAAGRADDGPRYALYYAPVAESALWAFGCGILGYDAECGADMPIAPPAGIEAAFWHDMRRKPAGYGFHGTLKAPFRLDPAYDEAMLLAAVTALAGSCPPFELPALELSIAGDFFALVPSAPAPEMNALARRAVLELDRFRAPLTEADRRRRNPHQLTPRQRILLEAHGYPFVLEEFRFHMTLTGAVTEGMREDVGRALAAAYAECRASSALMVQDIAVFRQEGSGQPFRLLQRFALADMACMVA